MPLPGRVVLRAGLFSGSLPRQDNDNGGITLLIIPQRVKPHRGAVTTDQSNSGALRWPQGAAERTLQRLRPRQFAGLKSGTS
jgi:hypothetical protein